MTPEEERRLRAELAETQRQLESRTECLKQCQGVLQSVSRCSTLRCRACRATVASILAHLDKQELP